MKKYALGIITGLFLTTTIVYEAYAYSASQISYKSTKSYYRIII